MGNPQVGGQTVEKQICEDLFLQECFVDRQRKGECVINPLHMLLI
jgi:hypothetical protein